MSYNNYINSASHTDKGNYYNTITFIDKQKQSLHYSYETLLNLLSAAENFAGLKNEQYGAYNISTATSYEELKSEFAWELHCFQLALKMYNKKYGEYIFHNELPKEKILSDIKRYITKVENENDKILYYAMMNLILGNKIEIDFDKLFNELDKNSNKSFDPNKLKNLIGPINHILDKIGENSGNPNYEYTIRKFKSNNVEKLINESKKNENTIVQVYLGKKGYLSKIEGKTNEYYFSANQKIYEKLIINGIITNGPKIYKIDNMDGFLYFYGSNFGKILHYFCILFKDKIKININIKDCQIIDRCNGIDILRINNNEHIFLYNNYEDFK